MVFNFTEIISATMVLFAVIDIIGSIPIILDIKKELARYTQKKLHLLLWSSCLLSCFWESVSLHLSGLMLTFAVAGSFVLFALAMEMILGVRLFKDDGASPKVASIVPLAFPIIAGAGSMTSILSLRAEYQVLNIAVAILLNIILVYLTLKQTNRLERFFGEGGIAVLRKVFGIVLLAIAIKLFSSNIKLLFI